VVNSTVLTKVKVEGSVLLVTVPTNKEVAAVEDFAQNLSRLVPKPVTAGVTSVIKSVLEFIIVTLFVPEYASVA